MTSRVKASNSRLLDASRVACVTPTKTVSPASFRVTPRRREYPSPANGVASVQLPRPSSAAAVTTAPANARRAHRSLGLLTILSSSAVWFWLFTRELSSTARRCWIRGMI